MPCHECILSQDQAGADLACVDTYCEDIPMMKQNKDLTKTNTEIPKTKITTGWKSAKQLFQTEDMTYYTFTTR